MSNRIAVEDDALPAPSITMSGPGDIIALVPYLLGFHPTESLVVLVVEQAKVRLTTRVDIEACFEAEYLNGFCEMLKHRFDGAKFLLVAVSCDRPLAEEALGLTEIALGSAHVMESLVADGQRYWSRKCDDALCCPPQGTPYPNNSDAVVVEAVGAGLAALDCREQIVDQIRALDSTQQSLASQQLRKLQLQIDELNFEQRRSRLDELLNQSAELTDEAALTLGLLVHEIKLRDRAWLAMQRSSAQQSCAFWASVVRKLPDEIVLPALCLAGMAAWLSGNGALHVACIERGKSLGQRYSMLDLLEALNLTAADPVIWDRMDGMPNESR